MNKVVLLGRLTRDPEVRYTQAAEPLAICRFSVAVDRPYSRNRQEGEPTADFINCVCFGKRGESIGQYFRKGNKIAVTGRIQTGSYTDQQGNKRYTTDVVLDDFEFVESKGEREASANSSQGQSFGGFAPQQNVGTTDAFLINDDSVDDADLPF